MSGFDRRQLLSALAASTIAASVPASARSSSPRGQLHPVAFDPRQFGAKGDGIALDSPAINAAINACTQAGGGIVYLAPGRYLSGTVVLKSNVTLYVEAGATLLGSTRISDYSLQPGPPLLGDADQNHLIFAQDADNVTLCGPGLIDGQGAAYWKSSGHGPLPPDRAWADVIAHGWTKAGQRPSPMLEFVNCAWLRIEDLRIENAAGWTMRPINCRNVYIHGISVKNSVHGPNTDGMDITGCTNVFVSDCSIDTGDDAICLKSENPYGKEPLLTQNVVVTNCVLTTCCNGFKLGTATQGGFENITFSNSVIYNNAVDLPQRVIAGIALEVVDGGWIDGVVITGIRMQRTRTPIFLRLGDRSRRYPSASHGLRAVTIENIHASESVLASSITGLENSYVEDVTLANIRVDNVLGSRPEWLRPVVPEVPAAYPEARMFGMLPASGLYSRHVRGLRVTDFHVRAAEGEQRPAVVCDDVRGLRIAGLSTTPGREVGHDGPPLMRLIQSANAWISGCAAPAGTKALLEVEGPASASILLSGCDLRGAERPFAVSGEAPPTSVQASGNLPG
jgi:polygalacturonase